MNRKGLALALVGVLAVLGAAVGVHLVGGASSADEATNAEPTALPPVEVAATDPPVVTAGGAVTVTVSFAGWSTDPAGVQVDGQVDGVIEDGGTCSVTLARGDETVTAEQPGAADASTTTCGSIAVGGPNLAAGKWTAVLSYASATSDGASLPIEIQVPTR